MIYTWSDVAVAVPDFVDWIRKRHGSVPRGEVDLSQYQYYLEEYVRENSHNG